MTTDVLASFSDAIDGYLSGGDDYVRAMLAAYCRRCKIDPLEVVLVRTEGDEGQEFWHFAKRTWVNDEMVVYEPVPWWFDAWQRVRLAWMQLWKPK
jgi:hypothetical protein